MATALSHAPDRRAEPRRAPHELRLEDQALLRPGQQVRVIDLSDGGAQLESASRLRPGTRAELHLTGPAGRCVRGGKVLRCQVAELSPLRYRGAFAFDSPLPTRTLMGDTGG